MICNLRDQIASLSRDVDFWRGKTPETDRDSEDGSGPNIHGLRRGPEQFEHNCFDDREDLDEVRRRLDNGSYIGEEILRGGHPDGWSRRALTVI